MHSFSLADVDQFPGVAVRAWRWAPEVREVADTLRDAALPADLALGAANALEHGMLAKDRDDLTVADVLDRLAER